MLLLPPGGLLHCLQSHHHDGRGASLRDIEQLVEVGRELRAHLFEVSDREAKHLRLLLGLHSRNSLAEAAILVKVPIVDVHVLGGHAGDDVSGAEELALLNLEVACEIVARQHEVHLALEEEVHLEHFVVVAIQDLVGSLDLVLQQLREPRHVGHGLLLEECYILEAVLEDGQLQLHLELVRQLIEQLVDLGVVFVAAGGAAELDRVAALNVNILGHAILPLELVEDVELLRQVGILLIYILDQREDGTVDVREPHGADHHHDDAEQLLDAVGGGDVSVAHSTQRRHDPVNADEVHGRVRVGNGIFHV